MYTYFSGALVATTFIASAGFANPESTPSFSLDKLSFESGASSLGSFIAPTYELTPQTKLRTSLYFGSSQEETNIEGNNITLDFDTLSLALLADYYLAQSGFRLTGGLAIGGYQLDTHVKNVTLSGTTYNGEFDFNLKQNNNIVPILAAGYTYNINERWGLLAEAGGKFTSFELTATGQENLSTDLQTDFNAEIADTNKNLDEISVVPFISLGVIYNF